MTPTPAAPAQKEENSFFFFYLWSGESSNCFLVSFCVLKVGLETQKSKHQYKDGGEIFAQVLAAHGWAASSPLRLLLEER